jgi:hypothetical protein
VEDCAKNYYNLSVFTSLGYVVLEPDIVFRATAEYIATNGLQGTTGKSEWKATGTPPIQETAAGSMLDVLT